MAAGVWHQRAIVAGCAENAVAMILQSSTQYARRMSHQEFHRAMQAGCHTPFLLRARVTMVVQGSLVFQFMENCPKTVFSRFGHSG